MHFLNGITILLGYQLLGEIAVLLFELSVPGPVLGMLLLFFSLIIKEKFATAVEPASFSLLSHLSLLFVPAGVGIMVHYERIIAEWVSISIALVVSTILTMTATALIMLLLQRLLKRGEVNND